jgi:hypothetical protein
LSGCPVIRLPGYPVSGCLVVRFSGCPAEESKQAGVALNGWRYLLKYLLKTGIEFGGPGMSSKKYINRAKDEE